MFGTRIWQSGLKGSYRQQMAGSINVNYRVKPQDILPGETVPLVWQNPASPVDELDYLYDLVLGERYYAARADCVRQTLAPGEYVVDAILQFTVWDTTGEVFHERLGDLMVVSNNKLWVQVGE
jgi:hypothetical protein